MKHVNWIAWGAFVVGSMTPNLFAGDPVAPEGNAELVDRMYDLNSLRHRVHDGDYTTMLFPTSQLRSVEGMGHWSSLSDELATLAGTVLWEEIEYDGRILDTYDWEHLFLRAPEATHTDVQALIEFMGRMCNAGTDMQLHWVQVPREVVAPMGVVPIPVVQDWLGKMDASAVRSHRVHVPATRPALVSQMRNTPTIVDANVEIAQGSATVGESVRVVGSGNWAQVRAIPSTGGVQLGLTWAAVSNPKLDRVDLQLGGAVGAEGKTPVFMDQGGAIQLMNQPAVVSSSRLFVPDGMASVMRVADADGMATLLVAVPGKAAPLEQSYQLTGPRKSKGYAFVLSSLLPPDTRWNLEEGFSLAREWDMEWCWSANRNSADWIADHVINSAPMELVEVNNLAGYLVVHTAHGVPRDQLPVANMEVERIVQRLRDRVAHRPSYMVELRAFRGDSTEVMHMQQVVAEGSSGSWFCGAERTFIREFDSEVAQYASIQDPHVQVCMEGSLVEFSILPGAEGRLQVQMQAHLNLPVGDANMNFNSPLHGDYFRPIYQTADFDNLQTLEATQRPGTFAAQFGCKGSDEIRLELTATRVD
ncbi:MAG: hypothetical protein KDB61_01760 [Planctomycetes bacterium]|nr:hypothetical protein [Planctomycetota bacterium]